MPQWPRRAVVDIGSNSVRLVIFSGPPRVPIPITNEKALCGLGDREPDTGNLRADAMERALSTLRRFRALIDTEGPETLDVFATAAVRDAPNGKSFLRGIEAIGFDPRLLSGKEEARLAGLGILCSAPEIIRDGEPALGGDLGGGSLELSVLGGPRADIGELVSLPIGALRMLSEYGQDRAGAAAAAEEHFSQLPWLSELGAPSLFIVGGSWRAIARVGMYQAEHELPILDHFTMTADQAQEVCHFVEVSSPELIGNINGVQKKRVPTLPMAAITLRKLIERSNAKQVVVSACGVREGLLFDRLPSTLRSEEPLFALSNDMAERLSGGRKPKSHAVASFIDPLFHEDERHRRVRHAASILIRTGNMSHPDRRAIHAGATVMAAPLLGVDHIERTLLAAMVASRFASSLSKLEDVVPLGLLSDDLRTYGVRVGYAHRLAASLRTPLYRKDSGFQLQRTETHLRLSVSRRVADFVAEAGVKDFERLAEAFKLQPEILSS